MSLQQDLTLYRQRLDDRLGQLLAHSCIEPKLQEAMRYSVFNGGKRVRPILIYLVNHALGGASANADAAACAIECVHSYSLIHDDLPAMDDDNLRRGQPTCHIAFDEATAILAGDALQCIAFEWLTNQPSNLSAIQQLRMVNVLSIAAGDKGMVAGQAFDLANVGNALTLKQLESMHRSKTGALISAAVELGIISSDGDVTPQVITGLRLYATAIGLAFQVQDDILDVIGDTATLGKPQGSDIDSDKPTYVSLLGLEGAREKLQQLLDSALEAVAPLGQAGEPLRQLAHYIVERHH